MNLRDFKLIYNKLPNFMGMKNGEIIGLYMIYEAGFVQFLIEAKYKNNDNIKIGLFGIDIEKKSIGMLSKEEYIDVLEKINFVNKKEHYFQLKNGLENIDKLKRIVEYKEYFIVIKEGIKNIKKESISSIKFPDINYAINANIAVLYASPNISSSYIQIEKNSIDKRKLEDINYLTNIEVNISYENNEYNDRGCVKKIQCSNDNVDIIIEPIEATLLENEVLQGMHFNNVTPDEIIKIMANITKSVNIGETDFEEKKNRKFKYITTLSNFEMEAEVLQVADIVFSKQMEDVEIERIKPNSKKYIYISTFVMAETIDEAQRIAMKKIESILNIIHLIQKNSCFYKLYNDKEEINEFDIKKIFIDYKIGDSFYIFNIFETEQSVYGINKGLFIKNYGCFDNQSDIALYNDEINELILSNIEEKKNLPNAIYWLNKGIEEINVDLNKCVLYLNIALEYCINGEKGKNFFEQNEEAKEIFENVNNYLNENYPNNKIANEMKNKLNNTLSSSSVKNRFEYMLENLNIHYTKKQFKVYNKIRDARNDIIHGRKKVKIQKRDIIEFYMLLSKVMFYKLKEYKK